MHIYIYIYIYIYLEGDDAAAAKAAAEARRGVADLSGGGLANGSKMSTPNISSHKTTKTHDLQNPLLETPDRELFV